MESLTEQDPRSIGGFEVRARIGKGGFGQVYLGLSPAGRAVAIKVLLTEVQEDRGFLRRFRLEVAAARRVNGLYTAQVVAAGLNERRPWIATVFVPGPPLDRVVAANGPLPEIALWRLLIGLVEALQEIHGCGLVHRDLKPANVLLATDGPRVIDFGISKSVYGTAMTSSGVVIGTPSFMAPEQADGRAVGPDADVFSLGCVLAYAATGRQPFGRGTAPSVLYRVVHEDPELDGIPLQLRAVIERCLAKAPEARPTLAELAKIGRRSPAAVWSQSSLAFWPPPLGALIREYQSQLDDVQDTQVPSATDLSLVGSGPHAAAPSTRSEGGYSQAGYQGTDNEDGYDYPGGYGQPNGSGAPGQRRGRRWLPWTSAAVVVAVLAAIAVAAIMLNSGGGASVPQVRGETQPEAMAQLDAAGLKPSVTPETNSQVKSGLVIGTSPAAGSAMRKGQTVTVDLSTGPATAVVPSVEHLTWSKARGQLAAKGLTAVEHTEASKVVKAGEVISVSPAAGTSVSEPGHVTVYVSTGMPVSPPTANPDIILSSVQGSQGTTAQTQLQNLGFTNVSLVSDPQSTLPSGEVDHMAPAQGTYPPGQHVVLYVSEGWVQVPNVVGKTQDEAIATLKQDGFAWEWSVTADPSGSPAPGQVYSEDPVASSVQPKNTTILIFVQPQATPAPSSTPTPANTPPDESN
jgi:beta-lactam-binding protein with PASTA domain/serine/threonine protein kinase